jgi:cystathionine beta-lyase/cystathionine gamma-synthase
MSFDPASLVQDYLDFGEFGDVNPSITDSSTFTFLSPARIEEAFDHDIEGCFFYSRHWNPRTSSGPRRWPTWIGATGPFLNPESAVNGGRGGRG